MGKYVAPERWERARTLLESGVSYRETTKLTGIAKSALLRQMPGLGVKPKPKSQPVKVPKATGHTKEQWHRAEALLKDGASYRETALTTGIPRTTLRERLPGYGWTPSESGSFRTMLNKNKVSKDVWDLNRRNNG